MDEEAVADMTPFLKTFIVAFALSLYVLALVLPFYGSVVLWGPVYWYRTRRDAVDLLEAAMDARWISRFMKWGEL